MPGGELGYYRQPTVGPDRIVFVSEDDLWTVPRDGGLADRLTRRPGPVADPALSPDGRWLAFSAADEGTWEVHVMPADGGEARRLTHHAEYHRVVGWLPDGERLVCRSPRAAPTSREPELFTVPRTGGPVERLGFGPATSAAWEPGGDRIALHRHGADPAIWKRYRGGRAGEIWVGTADGGFERLTDPADYEALPAWGPDGRIWFLSDRGGTGNLWSMTPDGTDRRRHTDHEASYVRWPSMGAGVVCYQHAADLWLLDPADDGARKVEVRLRSDGSSVRRSFADPGRHLETFALSPDRSRMLVGARGRVFSTGLYEGPVRRHGTRTVPDAVAAMAAGEETAPERTVRHRLPAWLSDDAIVTVSDASGEDEVVWRDVEGGEETSAGPVGGGRIVSLVPSPEGDRIACTDQALGLWLIDRSEGSAERIDESRDGRFTGLTWSADGRWLAYAKREGRHSSIHCHRVDEDRTVRVTGPEAHDFSPVFDPEGRWLWFLSDREIDPYPDDIQHDFGYPVTTGVYAAVLRSDEPSPFSSTFLHRWEERKREKKEKKSKKRKEGTRPGTTRENGEDETTAYEDEVGEDEANGDDDGTEPTRIDEEGLRERIVRAPLDAARWIDLSATKHHLVLVREPVRGLKDRPRSWTGPPEKKNGLVSFDIKKRESDVLIDGMTSIAHRPGSRDLLCRIGGRLRRIRLGKKVKDEEGDPTGRKTGWVDLDRVRIPVDPREEWRQIYHEAWRLQRDFFWTEDLGGVDWIASRDRHLPLLERVRTRRELTDLLWDLQGDLGTSHAYVIGGEVPSRPSYPVGLLGADLTWDGTEGTWRIARILRGDSWDEDASSPLAAPGLGVEEGDRILRVDGLEPGPDRHPYQILANRAGEEILLEVAPGPDPAEASEIRVETLSSETSLRYRDRVRRNADRVEERTDGRIGYLHLPDMWVDGLVEFHRGYLWQTRKGGLIVDVRSNGGGNVSGLLMAKLQREIIGYDRPRWGEVATYPRDAVPGPVVGICDQRTGSDGDIFCQAFKAFDVGPLVGMRTWGGVVGIWPRRTLIDGGLTTQPEFAHWFEGPGWQIENRGVEPTIQVENDPDACLAGEDPQLERAIDEALRLLEEAGPLHPEIARRKDDR